MNVRTLSTVFSLICAVALVGCGLTDAQRQAVTSFSESSATFGKAVGGQVVDMRTNVIKLNSQYLALSLGESSLPRGRKLDGALHPKNVRAYVEAAQAIQQYGAMLKAFVSDTQGPELKAAVEKFTASFGKLQANPKFQGLEKIDMGAVGQIIQSVGGLIIEHRKAKALKEIVPKVNLHIQTISEVFAEDFKTGGLVAEYYDSIIGLSDNKAIGVLSRSVTRASFPTRFLAAAVRKAAFERKRVMETAFPAISKSAGKLKAAHQALVNALQNSKYSEKDLRDFGKSVEGLVSAVRTFAISISR